MAKNERECQVVKGRNFHSQNISLIILERASGFLNADARCTRCVAVRRSKKMLRADADQLADITRCAEFGQSAVGVQGRTIQFRPEPGQKGAPVPDHARAADGKYRIPLYQHANNHATYATESCYSEQRGVHQQFDARDKPVSPVLSLSRQQRAQAGHESPHRQKRGAPQDLRSCPSYHFTLKGHAFDWPEYQIPWWIYVQLTQ